MFSRTTALAVFLTAVACTDSAAGDDGVAAPALPPSPLTFEASLATCNHMRPLPDPKTVNGIHAERLNTLMGFNWSPPIGPNLGWGAPAVLDPRGGQYLDLPHALAVSKSAAPPTAPISEPFAHRAETALTEFRQLMWRTGFDPAPGNVCHVDVVVDPSDPTGKGLQVASPAQAGLAGVPGYVATVQGVFDWFNYTVPGANKDRSDCKLAAAHFNEKDFGNFFKWYCFPTMFTVEYGRDPFGAGGFTLETRDQWLAGFRAVAKKFASTCSPYCDDRLLVGPGTIEDSRTDAISQPLTWFLDDAVASETPIRGLSVEILADDPIQAHAALDRVRDAAKTRGLRSYVDGLEPVLVVSDLRLHPDGIPPALRSDPVRASTYVGAVYYGASFLLADRASIIVSGRNAPSDPQCANLVGARGWRADLVWQGNKLAADGSPTPVGWGAGLASGPVNTPCVSTLRAADDVAVLVSHGECAADVLDTVCSGTSPSPNGVFDIFLTGAPAGLTHFAFVAAADWRVRDHASDVGPIEVALTDLPGPKVVVRQMSFDGATATWSKYEWQAETTRKVSGGKTTVSFRTRSPAMHYAIVYY